MRFSIIGYGRFGRLWAQALRTWGQVLVCDPKLQPENLAPGLELVDLSTAAQAEIVFVLVPISQFAAVCQDLQGKLASGNLVVDCCSVKIYPLAVMQKIFGQQQAYLATHPLFGPDSVKKTGGLAGHKLVVCHSQETLLGQQLCEIFRQWGLEIIFSTAEEHDRQMANTQSLVHFLGRGLSALDLKPQEISTPDFAALLNIQQMVNNDSMQLFLDMQHYNPYAHDLRSKLLARLQALDLEVDGVASELAEFLAEQPGRE